MLELLGCLLSGCYSSVSPDETSCLFDGTPTVGRARFRGHCVVENVVAMGNVVLLGQLWTKMNVFQATGSPRQCVFARQRSRELSALYVVADSTDMGNELRMQNQSQRWSNFLVIR